MTTLEGGGGLSPKPHNPFTDDPAAVWKANPHLALTHADLGAFVQCHWLARRELIAETNQARERLTLYAQDERSLALQRLALIRKPSGTGEHPPAVERRGVRLVVWIYGPVGDEGMRGPEIAKAVHENSDATGLIVRIASGGGYADEAMQIAGAIRSFPGRSVAIIDKFAYSGASAIAAAADRILIRSDASWMAHYSQSTFTGPAEGHQYHAHGMQALDVRLARHYATNRRIRADLHRLMRENTYLDASQAVAAGVADAVIEALPINWNIP